jgi:hypothetical protein
LRRRTGFLKGQKSTAYIVGMNDERSLQSVSDDELLSRLAQRLVHSRRAEADIVADIGEVDARKLYAREAFPSMFAYCTEALHLSEAEAYLRITVARAAREHPMLLEMLADGRLHLAGIVRLVPYLTLENRDLLLERATHRSKRQILEMLAELFPRPDAPTQVRKLPVRRTTGTPRSAEEESTPRVELCPDRAEPAVASPASRSMPVAAARTSMSAPIPLAPARYKVQFTASAELHDKLQRLRDLMRGKVPDGDLAAIIEEAVTDKLQRLEARRFGATKAPRTTLSDPVSAGSRHIPAAVKRAVTERDGRQCHYEDKHGRRCSSRAGLEYHHRHPFALGGSSLPENIRLLCKVHHRLQSEHDCGPRRWRGNGVST